MKEPLAPVTDSERFALVAEPALREALERYVRAKVPASEVEDIVQASLTDALSATKAPETGEDVRRWVYGIARHKIADHYRRAARERSPDSKDLPDVPAESVPHSAHDLLRWAEKELPEGEHAQSTLDWMLREGEGEKLERIAEEENVAAPQVRQRVSRMRRYFRDRWAQQLAAVAAVLLLVLAGLWVWATRTDRQPRIVREVPSAVPPIEQRVGELRQRAFEDCGAERWRSCLDLLDEAKRLDPAGDTRDDVQRVRREASEALAPVPDSSAVLPTPVPTTSSSIRTAPTITTAPVMPKAPSKADSIPDWSERSK